MSSRKSQVQIAIDYLTANKFKVERHGWAYTINDRKIMYGHGDIKRFVQNLKEMPALLVPCQEDKVHFYFYSRFEYRQVHFHRADMTDHTVDQIMQFIDLYRSVEPENDNLIERDKNRQLFISNEFFVASKKGWNLIANMTLGSMTYYLSGDCLLKFQTHKGSWYNATEHKFEKFKSLAQLEKLSILF